MNSNYRKISAFGSDMESAVNNPLTYTMSDGIDQRFLHGSHADTMGEHSRESQLYMSEYCSLQWDGFCEASSSNTSTLYPHNYLGLGMSNAGLNAGQALIKNTAVRKYLIKVIGADKLSEPFDPTVANSPQITYWNGYDVIPVFAVVPSKIDSDIVMNKILLNPMIAMDLLLNIYNTMKRMGTLSGLKGTKLGKFYQTCPKFLALGGI